MSTRPAKGRQPRPVKLTIDGKPSGLRNPSRAMRGLGSLTLALEALVLLLAILPLRMLQDGLPAAQLAVLLGGTVAAILITGLLRRPYGWYVALALQGLLLLGGLLHWMIGVVGLAFGLVWLFVLYVRRRILL